MSTKYSRFLDVDQELGRVFQPVVDFRNRPLVSLEEAVESIVFCCPAIRQYVDLAMRNCKNPAEGLNQNESASIYLYTMEWEPKQKCLHYALNATLRNENRNKLKPWFPYLRLIFTALQKLPSQQETIWRGATLNLSQQYDIGKRYVWWAFLSCNQSRDNLESEQFIGKYGPRTLFHIECRTGKSIQRHSANTIQNEILLLPAMQFEVKRNVKPIPDLCIIEIREVEPVIPLIELLPTTSAGQQIDQVKKSGEHLSNHNRNRKLKQKISKSSLNDKIELNEHELTDGDIPALCRLIIDRNCSQLNMCRNMIADEGAGYLGKMLQPNSTLQILELSKNQISNIGVRWIAEALQKNTTLIELNLGWNQVTDEGARSLSEVLHVNTTLKELHLYNNSIGDSGAQHLAQALIQNRTLTNLSVGDNEITEEGLTYLAQMLKQNSTLIELNLDENPLSNDGIGILMDALCHNRGLQTLWIKFWKISHDCIGDIQIMLKQNTTLRLLCLTRKSFSSQAQHKLQAISSKHINAPIFFSDWDQ